MASVQANRARNWPRRAIAMAIVLGGVLFAPSVRANDTVSIRIEYSAPKHCPGEQVFLDAIRARTSRVVISEGGNATLVRVAAGRASDGGHWGSLQLVEGGEVTGRRRVSGASCDEVVEALGLAAALSLDPESLMGPPPDLPELPPPSPPPPEPPPPPPPPPSPPPQRSWDTDVGVHATMDVPIVPWLFGGADVFVDLRHQPTGPTLRLGLGHAQSRNTDAVFRFEKAAFSLCPVRAPLGKSSAFLLCGGLDAGWLSGKGRNRVVTERATRSWFALSSAARIQVGLSERTYIELEGALAVPLTHRTFVIDTPPRELGATPSISPSGKIGIGFRP